MADKAKSIGWLKRQRDGSVRDSRRPHAAERGYGRRHQKFRAWLLTIRIREAARLDVAICEDCRAEGKTFMHDATKPSRKFHLNHKLKVADRPDLQYAPNNCQFLCDSHHNRRSACGE